MTDAPTVGMRRGTGAFLLIGSPRMLRATIINMWRQHRDLLANTVSLLATTGVTSALGFTFWTVAAREFSQQSVGYGSAAVSAMSLLSTIGVFGLGTVLIGELPRRNRRAGLVAASLLTSGIASLILGIVFAIAASIVSKRFEAILGKPFDIVVFGAAVALAAVALVFDAATIGLLRGGVQLSRNLVFGVAKMAALPITAIVIHDQFGTGIFLSWTGGIVASLAASAIWLRIHGSPIFPAPDWGVLRALGKTALAHNWLNLAIAVPITLIPVLVTIVVSPAANAVFYIAWMLTSFLLSIPVSLSIVLFAVAAAKPHIIAQKLRFALKLSLLVGVPAMLALCFEAHFILSFFGIGYARAATFPLWCLSLSYVPGLPKAFYVAVCRANGKISRAAVVLTTFAVAEIVAVCIGGHLAGLRGLSIAILAVTLIEGVATTPAVLRAASRHVTSEARLSYQYRRPRRVNRDLLDYNRKLRPEDRSTISLDLLGVDNDAAGRPEQTNSDTHDQQTGIAVLQWLASIQAVPEPPARHRKTTPR